MSKQYSPKRFFREAPNRFLQQYFSERNVLSDFDFSKLTETKIDPLYKAWLELPEADRNKVEQDFQAIDELATEGGSKAILDEALWHNENLAAQFAELKGFHEHAFWTFLECPKLWLGAILFNHADTLPTSYWRKRKNLPKKIADVDPVTILKLEKALSDYFHNTQGRGHNCKVDCYKRNELDYFFAYPEDYAQASIEWEGSEFKRRSHHPAFEVIFVYSQNDGTLNIYISGDRKVVPDLQIIFANVILKEEIGEDEKDERVYNLNPLKSRHFNFTYGPESGITEVSIKKLRLNILGTKERITLESDPLHNKDAIFDFLDKATKNVPNMQFVITQVGIKVTFIQNPLSRKNNTRSFDISWPNSCSLKQDGRDLIIRKLLVDSGIEPQKPTTTDGAVE